MTGIELDPGWLYAAASCTSSASAVELAELAGAAAPVTPRTLRRLRGRRVEYETRGAPVAISREVVAELLELHDGTRAGLSAFRLACELIPRLRGAAAAGRLLVVPVRHLCGRTGMSAPSVVRALRRLQLSGLVAKVRGRYTRLCAAGVLRAALVPPRTHLKRLSKERKRETTGEPREARPPVRIAPSDVVDVLAALGLDAPSATGARRCAFTASRAGYGPPELLRLARGALGTLRAPGTQSPAGVLGWLASRHRPPTLGESCRAQSIGDRLDRWVRGGARRGAPVVSGWFRGRRRSELRLDVLLHASRWGYNHPEMCRELARQAGILGEVPQTEADFWCLNYSKSTADTARTQLGAPLGRAKPR